MPLRRFLLIKAFLWLSLTCLQGQSDCIESYGSVYGSPDANERGTCLVPTPGNDAMYVAGMREDSALLLKIDISGEVLWARTFDIIPGEEEYVCSMILDSEGMLAMAGIVGDISDGGTVFTLRYNPGNHQILWATEYISAPTNVAHSLIQKGPGGNYLITNNPHYSSNDDLELLEINKNTGAVMPAISKHYILGIGSEGLAEIIYDGNFIYGVGRYTDGGSLGDMRNTIVKMNPTNGSHIWTRMGHVNNIPQARLYGTNILLDQGELVSAYYGDPVSISTTNTKLYLQKTSLDGDIIWLKQYELPGNNDVSYALIKSGGGYVVLAGKGAPSGKLILFKVNADGSFAWGRNFQNSAVITTLNAVRGQSKLIEVGGKLVFTAIGANPGGMSDMLVVMTDLNGMINNPCVTSETISIPVTTISNPVFYPVSPTESIVDPTENSEFPQSNISTIPPRSECVITDTLYSFITAAICEGDDYEGYSLEGTYVDEFTTSEGCDSIRTLELSVTEPESTNEQISICLGETYQGYSEEGIYVNTFQNVFGCDSIHTLNLQVIPLSVNPVVQICEGQEYEGYSSSGLYIDTLQGQSNTCDTIRFLDLTVQPLDQTSFDVTICDGEEYEGYSTAGVYVDLFTGSDGCDSLRTLDLDVSYEEYSEEEIVICLGESHEGYSEEGIYIDTLQNNLGCDSIHTLTLLIEALEIDLSVGICQGEHYDGYTVAGSYIDTLQSVENSCDTIRNLELTVNSIDETTIDAFICSGNNYEGYTVSGLYVDEFVNVNGCDSIRTLDLTVADEILVEIEAEICPGDSYEGYTEEGTYVDEFTTSFGCDSIRTLHLTLEMPEVHMDVALCMGGQFEGYTEAGDYTDIITGAPGECDTLRHLKITIESPLQTFVDPVICSGENYSGYTETGVYIDTLQTPVGCDSIVTINLLVTDELQTNESVSICTGETYEGYFDSGIYLDTFSSVSGCDSIRTLILTVGIPEKMMDVSICYGSQFENYDQAGFYIDTIQGIASACDTLRYLNLTVTPPLETLINRSVCEGQDFLGYTTTGVYADTFQTAAGCDSVRVLGLTVSDIILENLNLEICPGESYEGYTSPGIYNDTFVSAFGCDSVRTLNLNVEMPATFLEISICSGGEFENYTEAGFYVDTVLGLAGACDTVRHLNLSVAQAQETLIEHTICEGQSFLGYHTTGVYTDTFQTVDGCDSIRILELTVSAELVLDQFVEICLGHNYKGYSTSGLYIDTLQAVLGCDSIIRLQLNVVPVEKIMDVEICSGRFFENYSLPGIYIDTLKSQTAECDTVRHLSLTVLPATQTTLEKAICAGDNYYGYTSTGAYTDTLIAIDGCDSVRTVMLSVGDGVLTHVEASICEGIAFGYSRPGIFIDTLTSYAGCDSIRTLVLKGGSLYVPNVFSPNNDSRNDFFELFPSSGFIPDLHYFAIFDRFGNMAYETEDFPVKWDGRDNKGQRFNPAVFTYVLIYLCGDKKVRETGDITLIR